MRGTCLGFLLLLATATGCATDPEADGGYFEGYNGFPWPSLLKKNADRNNDDAYLHPQSSATGRFARQAGTVTPNPDAAEPQAANADATSSQEADADSAEEAPAAKTASRKSSPEE